MKNKVTVIIPIYNPDKNFLYSTLEKIVTNHKESIDQIILVDDGSPEDINKDEIKIKSLWNQINIVHQLNKGPGGARNKGVEYARTEIVVFLDQDCRPKDGWLDNLTFPIIEDNFIAVMGSIDSYPSNSRIAQYVNYIGRFRHPKKDQNGVYKCLVTMNFAIHTRVFKEIGGFDERLKIAAEDLDLTYKLVKSGYGLKLTYAENATVYHAHRETIKNFYKQQYGYGFGTMSHCIFRNRDTREFKFSVETKLHVIKSLFSFFINTSHTLINVPIRKYGSLNKFIIFPGLEYIRQFARMRGHLEALKIFGENNKKIKKDNYAFVSIITTDDYLPGLLVLYKSLMAMNTIYQFLVLLTSDISKKTISELEKQHIPFKIISEIIENPTDVNRNHRWFPTYSKLHVFNQTQYEKVVYLDADMLILRNIDELFEYKHMSATNAGGMLPRKSSWTHINSGLFVLEPSHKLFEDMVSKVGKIEKIESGGTIDKPKYGSDQDFLNAYYPDWLNKNELHLDHKYNIFHYYFDEYNELFGYTIKDGVKPVFVIHYASYLKPWNMTEDELNELSADVNRKLESEAVKLWLSMYKKIKL